MKQRIATTTTVLGLMAGGLAASVCASAAVAAPPQEVILLEAQLARSLDDLDHLTGRALVSVQIAATVTLQAFTIAELLGTGSTTIDLGGWMPGADPTAGVTPQPVVTRTIDSLWTAWVTGSVNQVDVQLSLVGLNGQPDCISHPDDAGQTMPVTLTPLGPVQIDKDKNEKLVEGGVELTIDTSGVTAAGTYGGTLLVTVNQF